MNNFYYEIYVKFAHVLAGLARLNANSDGMNEVTKKNHLRCNFG